MDPPGIPNQNRAIGVLGQGRAGGEGWLFDAVVFQIVWEHRVWALRQSRKARIVSVCRVCRVKNSNDKSHNLHSIVVMPIEIFKPQRNGFGRGKALAITTEDFLGLISMVQEYQWPISPGAQCHLASKGRATTLPSMTNFKPQHARRRESF